MNEFKNDLISVVVPIYNVEKYLPACLYSIINQTYSNMEIILVDDGSEDRCPEICDTYKKKDCRIKVINKKNGGLSDARNAGMKIAKGNYITFVDSDDLLDPQFIEILYDNIKKTGSDISFSDYQKIDENCSYLKNMKKGNSTIYSNKECLKKLYNPDKHGLEFVAWGKLYNINLFKNNDIIYPYGKIHEDIFTTYKLCYFAKKIVFYDSPLYYYRIRTGSIMNTHFNIKRINAIEGVREACEFFKGKNEMELLQYSVNALFHSSIAVFYEAYMSLKGIERKSFFSTLIKNYKNDLKKYLIFSKMSLSKKLFYIIFGIIPNKMMAKIVIN